QQYHQQQRQQEDANYGPMKRASSMSVLNNVPLQQQPMNRPLGATNSVEQQNNSSFKQQYSSKFSGRLTSAENFH
ncbi:unnamed protein product, partial [Rotaria socialis]